MSAAVEAEALEDMELNVLALKKREGLRFFVIPQKPMKQMPWIIVGTDAQAQLRFTKARQAIKQARDEGLKPLLAQEGEVHLDGAQLYFVTDDPGKLEEGLRRKWQPWMTEYGTRGQLKKQAALFRSCRVVTPAEWAEGPREPGPDDATPKDAVPAGALDDDELGAIFGDDAVGAVHEAVTIMDRFNELLQAPKVFATAVDPEAHEALAAAIDELVAAAAGAEPMSLLSDPVRGRLMADAIVALESSPAYQDLEDGEALAAQTHVKLVFGQLSAFLRLVRTLEDMTEDMRELAVRIRATREHAEGALGGRTLGDLANAGEYHTIFPGADAAEQLDAAIAYTLDMERHRALYGPSEVVRADLERAGRELRSTLEQIARP